MRLIVAAMMTVAIAFTAAILTLVAWLGEHPFACAAPIVGVGVIGQRTLRHRRARRPRASGQPVAYQPRPAITPARPRYDKVVELDGSRYGYPTGGVR